MEARNSLHQARIQRVGKILWVFSWIWLVFNSLALLVVLVSMIAIWAGGKWGDRNSVIQTFSNHELIPGIDSEIIAKIVAWDYQNYLDHFWLSMFYMTTAAIIFLVTMILILKIASAWKRGAIFESSPIRCFRALGWIYLVHGLLGFVVGVFGQFWGNTHTAELIYFSFIRDVSLYSFSFSGSGIEWGLLALTLSWILEHARIMRDEQELTV